MTIRSAIYLAGNKYKLWPQIKPFIEDENRATFIDLFGGSATVSINVVNEGLYENVIYNEKACWLHNLNHYLKRYDCLEELQNLNESYSDSKEDYYDLQGNYNYHPTFSKLFLLMCRGNSNMVRFNSRGLHNMSWGNRKPFHPERISQHQQLIQDVNLWDKDFGDAIEDILFSDNLDKTTIYLDPPYYGTTAQYNECGGWTENDNTSLFEYAVELHNKGAKVIMSNVFENRGVKHTQLIEWCEEHKDKFDVHHLNISYNNSSFRKGKGLTDEVLIVSKV